MLDISRRVSSQLDFLSIVPLRPHSFNIQTSRNNEEFIMSLLAEIMTGYHHSRHCTRRRERGRVPESENDLKVAGEFSEVHAISSEPFEGVELRSTQEEEGNGALSSTKPLLRCL